LIEHDHSPEKNCFLWVYSLIEQHVASELDGVLSIFTCVMLRLSPAGAVERFLCVCLSVSLSVTIGMVLKRVQKSFTT